MLTDSKVRHAKAIGKNYMLSDSKGLALFVSNGGAKYWHFRFSWLGQRPRISLGTYPELSLEDARKLRDKARSKVAKHIDPRAERKERRAAIEKSPENKFVNVYEKWLDHRKLSLVEGRQTSLSIIPRAFKKDVFPVLKNKYIYEVTRPMLLQVLSRVEKRGALSVAEKLRSWLRQLFDYAMVLVPGMRDHPATGLNVVAIPLPPVEHNPFLRMHELPLFLQTLQNYRGRHITQLAIRLLLLTGVRTGELRLATPEQFDLDRGLWLIPVSSLKQHKMLIKKKRIRATDIPPYIVPLSAQAQEIVRLLLSKVKRAQIYLFPGARRISDRMSENAVNSAIKRLGYDGRLTAHGLRATLSTALNELGYPKVWVDSQLSHSDPNRISATYNHAEYVEQRRLMIQDWANRLDLFEQGQVQIASTHLTIHVQGVSAIGGEHVPALPTSAQYVPTMLVTSPEQNSQTTAPLSSNLAPAKNTDFDETVFSKIPLYRMDPIDVFESPENMVVADFAKLVGKSRRWISYEIQAGNLLALRLGRKSQRVPAWQLEPLKRQLVQRVLQGTPRGVDAWDIFHALHQPREALGGKSSLNAITEKNITEIASLIVAQCSGLPRISLYHDE